MPPPEGLSQEPAPLVSTNCTAAVVGSKMAHQPGEGSAEKATSTHALKSPWRKGGLQPLK